jgi:hypothetical protein
VYPVLAVRRADGHRSIYSVIFEYLCCCCCLHRSMSATSFQNSTADIWIVYQEPADGILTYTVQVYTLDMCVNGGNTVRIQAGLQTLLTNMFRVFSASTGNMVPQNWLRLPVSKFLPVYLSWSSTHLICNYYNWNSIVKWPQNLFFPLIQVWHLYETVVKGRW